MFKSLQKFIGTKEFYHTALAVAIPMMMQQLITSSVNLIDNLMVGQLGDMALAGVAAVNKFYMIATFGTNGLLAASAIFIAQFYGARDFEKMKESFRFSLIFASLIMVTFFGLGYFYPNTIVSFFTEDALIVEQGVLYLHVAAFTFLPMIFSLSISSGLRAIGETKVPLYVSVVAVVTNTVLNYCLIFGHFGFPQMAVQGAALATLIARCIEAVIFLVVLMRVDVPFKTRLIDVFNVPMSLSKQILIKAAPLATNEVLWSSGMATLFKLYGTRGAEVIAGYSIANTISDIFFILFGGMAAASTVLISHHLGANELAEARRNGYRLIGLSVMLSIVFAALMFGSSFIVPKWYQVSLESRHVAETVLRIMACMFWVYMLNTQCYFTLRAGGDTKSTLLMDSVYMWCVNISLVTFLAYCTDLNIYMLYFIGQLTDLIKMVIGYGMVKKEKWVVNLTNIKG